MAQQAAVNGGVSDVRKPLTGGRPPGSRNVKQSVPGKVPVKTEGFDYSQWDVTLQKVEDWYRYTEGYPDKSGTLCYVYRTQPKIDLGLIGIEETAILKTKEEDQMTEAYIGDTFGRGKYMLCFNDANRPRGQKNVCKTFVTLSTANKPPQYDLRTLCLGESTNQDEIQRHMNMGTLIRDRVTGAPRVRTSEDGLNPPAPAPQPTYQPNGSMGLDVNQVLLGLINRGSANPHDTVKDTIEMARLLAPPPVDIEGIIERVATRLSGARGGGSDPFSNYEKVEGFLERFAGARGGPAATGPTVDSALSPSTTGWAPHVPGIIREARALLPEIIGAWNYFKSTPGSGAQPSVRPNVPQTDHQPTQPRGETPKMTLLDAVRDVLLQGFEAMNKGVQGFDYAAWVVQFHPAGKQVYPFLEEQGTAGVMGLIAMDPESSAIANDPVLRPQVEAFLNDFFTYVPGGGSGGDGATSTA